jgi:hypothetical protein
MKVIRCIAMAYGEEPLDRLAVYDGGAGPFIVNPSYEYAIKDGSEMGVRFPQRCLFEADSQLFSRLRAAFDSGNREVLVSLWNEAMPLKRN